MQCRDSLAFVTCWFDWIYIHTYFRFKNDHIYKLSKYFFRRVNCFVWGMYVCKRSQLIDTNASQGFRIFILTIWWFFDWGLEIFQYYNVLCKSSYWSYMTKWNDYFTRTKYNLFYVQYIIQFSSIFGIS